MVGEPRRHEEQVGEPVQVDQRRRIDLRPGGQGHHPALGAAALHLARAVCRRAERRVVALAAQAEVDPEVLIYLNRLSDYLFMAARVANLRAGQAEHHWDPKAAR